MRRKVSAAVAVLLVLLTVFSFSFVGVYADSEDVTVSITAPKDSLYVGAYLQLSAEIVIPDSMDLTAEDFDVVWTASGSHAKITDNGLLIGVTPGKTTVTVEASGKESGDTYKAEKVFDIMTALDDVNSYMGKKAVMGLRFNTDENFYFYDQDSTWQKNMGFMNAFDYVSPYLTLVYDYVRVNYNYDGEAKMVQLWKGQYGIMFFGSEIGYYRMDDEIGEDEEITPFTHYKCATEDQIPMQSTLYWDKKNDGEYKYQFTVPYGDYWWCTGFRPGHLWNTEPCDELRMEGFIDFHDEEEAASFCEGLESCGFTKGENASTLVLDSFSQDGNRVNFVWQNISQAQNTKVVKATTNALITTGGLAMVFMPLGFLFMTFISMSAIFFMLLFV